MSGLEELDELVRGLTRGLDDLRSRLGAWAQDGPHQPHQAESGGVRAEATLATGLTSLQIDPTWVEGQDLDDVARCVVAAVNDAEAACRDAVWTSFGDVGLDGVTVAGLGDAAHPWRTSPADFFSTFRPRRLTEEDA